MHFPFPARDRIANISALYHIIVHLPTDCSSSRNVLWIFHSSGHSARRKQFTFQRVVSLVSSVFSVSSLHAWGLVVVGPWCLYTFSDKPHTMLKHSLLPIAPYLSDFLFLFSLLFMNCHVKVLFYNAQYIVHIICFCCYNCTKICTFITRCPWNTKVMHPDLKRWPKPIFDKPIFKLLPIEFDLMCNLSHFYHFVYM